MRRCVGVGDNPKHASIPERLALSRSFTLRDRAGGGRGEHIADPNTNGIIRLPDRPQEQCAEGVCEICMT